jgi:hypothetical protein
VTFHSKKGRLGVVIPGDPEVLFVSSFAANQACRLLRFPFKLLQRLRSHAAAEALNDLIVTTYFRGGDEDEIPNDDGYITALIEGDMLRGFRSILHGQISDYELMELAHRLIDAGKVVPIEMWRGPTSTELWLGQVNPLVVEVAGIPFSPAVYIRNSEVGSNGVQVAKVFTTAVEGSDQAVGFYRWGREVRDSIYIHLNKRATLKMQKALVSRSNDLYLQSNFDEEASWLTTAALTPGPEEGQSALEHCLCRGVELQARGMIEARADHLRKATDVWGGRT